MPNYSIGLSGLMTSSESMNVISNNIANASTSGYRAGDFVFEDQFYKAMNPMDKARAGMGDAKQNIRRFWNMGAIQSSANTLDMAITGSNGLFRLTSNADDPAQTYYTRNGQFAISKDVDPSYPKRSYIVNENGMFLTGYTSTDGKTLTSTHSHRLTMPPVTVDPVTTENSTVSVTLDARKTAFIPEANIQFDPQVPTSYSNKVSQTVYHLGDSGSPHTLELYYRRVEDKNMTVSYDGTFLKFQPNSVADPKASTEPQGAVVETNNSYVVLTAESSGPNFDYLSSANRKTNATVELKGKDYINVDVNADINNYARVIINGKDTGVVKKPNDAINSQVTLATPTPASGVAEVSTVTIAGNYLAGDKITVNLQGRSYEHTVTVAQAGLASPAKEESIANSIRDLIAAEQSALDLASVKTKADDSTLASGLIELVAATKNDNLDLSVSKTSAAGTATAAISTAASGTAEVSNITLSGTYKVGDKVSVQLQGKVYTHDVTAAQAALSDTSTPLTQLESIANSIRDLIAADASVLSLASVKTKSDDATLDPGLIEVTGSVGNDNLNLSVWAERPAQSSGEISSTRLTSASASDKEVSKATLSGTFAEGDRVSMNLQGLTYTYTVVAGDTTRAAVVEGLFNLIDAAKASLNVTVSKDLAKSSLTVTAGNTNDPLDVAVSVNRAVQLSGDISVNEDDEVMFFNAVTTAFPGAAVSPESKVITVATADSAIEVGQYLWKKGKDGVFTQLDAKVVEMNGKQLTLDKAVTLKQDDEIVFYQPVTYTVMLQDGSKVMMTGEHKKNAAADAPQEFTAVTSQVEVYGGLDGTMFNGTDSRFTSDTAINPTVRGTYNPLATIQFWGGQNIDAIRFDSTTGEAAFKTAVQLKGIVTSSGKTNGPGNLAISEDHPLEFMLDLTGTQHFATSFSVDANYQDGSPMAMLNNVTIDPEGKIMGTYSDGREFLAGQLVLVNFAAVNGLVPSGNNVFQASYMSGSEVNENVIVGKPNERGLGGIRAGALEGSNVDLASELVKLLIQQRMYSANSQSIRAFDDTLTTTIRMTGG